MVHPIWSCATTTNAAGTHGIHTQQLSKSSAEELVLTWSALQCTKTTTMHVAFYTLHIRGTLFLFRFEISERICRSTDRFMHTSMRVSLTVIDVPQRTSPRVCALSHKCSHFSAPLSCRSHQTKSRNAVEASDTFTNQKNAAICDSILLTKSQLPKNVL